VLLLLGGGVMAGTEGSRSGASGKGRLLQLLTLALAAALLSRRAATDDRGSSRRPSALLEEPVRRTQVSIAARPGWSYPSRSRIDVLQQAAGTGALIPGTAAI